MKRAVSLVVLSGLLLCVPALADDSILTLDANATRPTAAAGSPASLSIFYENDGGGVGLFGTDKHQTASVGLALASQCSFATDVGKVLPSFWNQFSPDNPGTTFAIGVVAGLDIYTPEDTLAFTPDPSDWPYNGWLRGGIFYQRAATPAGHHGTFEHMELDIGQMGNASLARQTQEFVHRHIYGDAVNGWDTRVHDETGFDLSYQRKWRFDLLPADPARSFGFQAIPQFGGTAGTIHVFGNVGAMLRAGWNLPDDFGPGQLNDLKAYTGQPYTHDLGGYFFLRAQGFGVAHNATIEGNNFRSSPGTDIENVFGEFQTGVAIQFLQHCELAWSQRVRSSQITSQSDWDGFGLLSLTCNWMW